MNDKVKAALKWADNIHLEGHFPMEIKTLALEVRRLREGLQKIAAYEPYEYGEDDADDLDTLRIAGETCGRGMVGDIARSILKS